MQTTPKKLKPCGTPHPRAGRGRGGQRCCTSVDRGPRRRPSACSACGGVYDTPVELAHSFPRSVVKQDPCMVESRSAVATTPPAAGQTPGAAHASRRREPTQGTVPGGRPPAPRRELRGRLSCAAAAPWAACCRCARPAAPRCGPAAGPAPTRQSRRSNVLTIADALAACGPARPPHQPQSGEGAGTDHHTAPTGAQRSRAASRWGGKHHRKNPRTTSRCQRCWKARQTTSGNAPNGTGRARGRPRARRRGGLAAARRPRAPRAPRHAPLPPPAPPPPPPYSAAAACSMRLAASMAWRPDV
jgi:hypothetical protein